jgi:hypothetical protein
MAYTAEVVAVTNGNQTDSGGANPAYAKLHCLMSDCLAKAHSRVNRDHHTGVCDDLRSLVYPDEPGFHPIQVKRHKAHTMRVVS